MKYIGLIKTDDLPSTSIGLRVSEMAKLGFSPIILYAKTRTTVAKQFRRGTVISNEQKLKDEIAKQGDCLIVIAAKHSVDANGIKALGEPKEMECRCLTGQRFVGCTSEGERSVVKVFEYDRRRGVSRFDRGDSGDVRIDMPNNKGLMVMRSSDFVKMLAHGDSFISAGEDFRKTADAVNMRITCVDPAAAGVKWQSAMIHDEKKPINVVYGEKVLRNERPVVNLLDNPSFTSTKPDLFNSVRETNGESGMDNKEDDNTLPSFTDAIIEQPSPQLPVLPVLITTHNRTKIARVVIESLVKNLKYDGKLLWCICDDRSDIGHVQSLSNKLKSLGVPENSIATTQTTPTRYGLGASLNTGFELGFSVSDIIFTTEDDWMLEKPINLTVYVRILLSDPNVGMIRLAAIGDAYKGGQYNSFLSKIIGTQKRPWILNNQVALRHKRLYEFLGNAKYPENIPSGKSEEYMRDTYNRKTSFGRNGMKILAPSSFEMFTIDHPSLYFTHVGKSTAGHDKYFPVPVRYQYLYDPERVIVAMTSYPKRISNVAKSMILLMDDQTRPPDEIHLYLSKDEFELYEKSLPEDLQNVLQCHNIFTHWTESNTFVHKRHDIFRTAPDNSCVFLVDDDVKYDSKLIEENLLVHEKYPLSILNYEAYSEHVYAGNKILYRNFNKFKEPSVRIRWCGQSMIPSYMYPTDSLSPENVAVRTRICPVCDESWLTPWIVHSRVTVHNQHFGWGTDIDPNIDHKKGLCMYTRQIVDQTNNMSRRDVWLMNVLNQYPALKKDYEEMFSYGK